MTEKEVLLHLINQTGYVNEHFYLAVREEVAKNLREAGYVYDDDGVHKFTDNGKQVLNDFYYSNKERAIAILKRLGQIFSYEQLCNKLEFDEDNRAQYLLVRLKQDGIINISDLLILTIKLKYYLIKHPF